MNNSALMNVIPDESKTGKDTTLMTSVPASKVATIPDANKT